MQYKSYDAGKSWNRTYTAEKCYSHSEAKQDGFAGKIKTVTSKWKRKNVEKYWWIGVRVRSSKSWELKTQIKQKYK